MAAARKRNSTFVPKYKTKDGDYLDIYQISGVFVVAWNCAFDGDERDMGCVIGDEGPIEGLKSDTRDDWEVLTARKAVESFGKPRLSQFASDTMYANAFAFETRPSAKKALDFANALLNRGREDVPWPDWALKAKAAGWNPPPNWKPE